MWEFVTAVIVAALTGYITFRVQEERLKKELKTEFMAEKVVKELLSKEKWEQRSFEAIKKRARQQNLWKYSGSGNLPSS